MAYRVCINPGSSSTSMCGEGASLDVLFFAPPNLYLALPRGAQWRPVSSVEISIGDPLEAAGRDMSTTSCGFTKSARISDPVQIAHTSRSRGMVARHLLPVGGTSPSPCALPIGRGHLESSRPVQGVSAKCNMASCSRQCKCWCTCLFGWLVGCLVGARCFGCLV